MNQHVYFSPHLDDAVFSCGGLIARQTAAGDTVTVLTICAGDPPPGDLSPFAHELHVRWTAQDSPSAMRRAEDQAACERLCAAAIHLDVPDAVYRQGVDGEALYPEEAAIFGSPHKSEGALVARLTEELAGIVPEEALIYCPLGYGGHVDHRLTRRAAERLGRPLWYYRDMPYALRGESVPSALGIPPGHERIFKLREDEIERWIEASAAYRSQISTFWTDEAALRQELRACHGGQGGLRLLAPGL